MEEFATATAVCKEGKIVSRKKTLLFDLGGDSLKVSALDIEKYKWKVLATSEDER